MKYFKDETFMMDMDGGEDANSPRTCWKQPRICVSSSSNCPRATIRWHAPTSCSTSGARWSSCNRTRRAWDAGREAFDLYAAAEVWEGAVQAWRHPGGSPTSPESLVALGQGIWLAVTYPVDSELTVAMLQHVVDETRRIPTAPRLAATAAHYRRAARP